MTETIRIVEALCKLERLTKATRSAKLKAVMAKEYRKLVTRLDEIETLEKIAKL